MVSEHRARMTRESKKSLIIFLSIIGVLCLLAYPFRGFPGLPHEQRYKYIDEASELLDYHSAGEVLLERYDRGDGAFSPSFRYVELESSKAFDVLTARTKSLKNVTCTALYETGTRCYTGQVNIEIHRESITSSKVKLQIIDVYSGRHDK